MAKAAIEKVEILNLEDFKKHIKKTFGKDTIISAIDEEGYKDVIPCTPFSLQNALGIGGFAKGKIYTIDGDLSSGKSTTAYDIIGQSQKTFGDECLLLDKEDSYTQEYGTLLNIDNTKLTIARPQTQQDMYNTLIPAIESNLFGVIVVDSVTAFAPLERFQGSDQMGIEAKVNSAYMRLINNAMAKSNTCLILIQQTREAIGKMGGDPTVVSGGKAIPFFAHVRIRITRSVIDRELQQNIMKFTIIKNKLASPYKVGTVVYKWGVGFDFFSEIADLAVEFGIIRNEKTSYFPPETQDLKIVGKKNIIQYLNDNPEYTKNIIQPLVLSELAKNKREEDLSTLEVLEDAE